MSKNLHFETLAIHAGQENDPCTGAQAVPIYQTTAYAFRDSEHAANLFSLKESGNIYTRISNPTTEVFEKRVAALEGGVGAVATASGQAASLLAILNIAESGEEIIAASSLYGGTYTLLASTLKKFGIKVNFIESSRLEGFRQAITPRTKAIFTETIGNPSLNVLDIESLANIAHEANIPLIVDNTFATPYLCRPFELGADIVVHSATKYLGGHGNSIGGIIVDGGKFDWAGGNFPGISEPDPSYHGIRYTESFGSAAYITKVRLQLLRDMGPSLSPFNAFLFLQGIETLPLRMERHCQNALAIAHFLERHDKVAWVNYPGLENHPSANLVKKVLPKGAGAMLTFGIKGGLESGKRLVNNLSIISLVANLGDVRTLIIHPASTTHQQLSEQEQDACGVSQDMIRLSVGLENVDDLILDLEEGLAKV